ncbi:hypothetical protein D0864_06365 [Hortaea werneckii]|uniref:Major facilitator superfamily (MFS) profile domain-containing protein n=1 Tax=Hortaea werneckii TaxID=91943 RepID=A0A3M7FM43_HORWE|nr:hypothetical protein D0864_06365 [Hortaea werneckii]
MIKGGVNTTRDYAELMTFGHWTGSIVHVDKPLLQGGIVAVYYLPGTLIGALWGGWLGDRYGRIFTIAFATLWAIVGAALQCSAMNADWMFCARVFNGVGTGILNAITPVWATETASHTSHSCSLSFRALNVRGQKRRQIFGANQGFFLSYSGTSFYGDGTSGFIWRFPIAFQIVPLLALLAIVWWMPESPRWLVKVGRDAEARFILGRLRGEAGDDEGLAEAEFQDIKNICRLEQENSQQSSYVSMLLGLKQGKLHTARRVQLVVWLQILQEWIGIAGITIYGPTIFTIAGIAPADRQWVSGLNNITYMFATLICVFTLDRIGRRWTLWWGAAGQAITLFCAGGLAYATQHSTGSHKEHVGGAAVFFVFLYTAIFGATWLTVPWLYPAEIFPLQIRAKGNAWGVIGWSIGNGWTVLLLPTIFERLNEKTLYVFGAVNIFAIGVVWAFYPESNQRTLEEMNLVFAADSVWTWDAEKHFAKLKEQNPDLVRAARRGSSVGEAQLGMVRRLSVEENEKEGARRVSLAAVAEAKDL